MIGPFETLLEELGKELNLELYVDHQNACSLKVSPFLTVQIQLDSSYEYLLLFAKIGETPSGKYRENILKEAMRANALPDPRPAYFAYLYQSNELVQFQRYPIDLLTGERVSGYLGAFVEMAHLWQDAFKGNQSAPIEHLRAVENYIFGLE